MLVRRLPENSLCFHMAAFGGLAIIAERGVEVARHAARLLVHVADVEQGCGFVLFGRLAVPGQGFVVVACYAQPLVVQVAEVVLRGGVALFRGLAVPG